MGSRSFCQHCGGPMAPGNHAGHPRPVCQQCGRAFFQDPKLTVGALVERSGQLLLVRRAHNPGRGQWCPPCGFVDPGEHPADAAAREVAEEAGIAVTITGLLDIYVYTDDPRGAGVMLMYLAQPLDEAPPRPGDDAADAAFFDPQALPPLSFPIHAQAIAAWCARRA